MSTLSFPALAPALAPAEARGASRVDVALLVASRSDGEIRAARFEQLSRFLDPGDLLVVNTSATMPAALPARLADAEVRIHLSTSLGLRRWVIEFRSADLKPLPPPPAGADIELPGGAEIALHGSYSGSERLVEAEIAVPGTMTTYLAGRGAPIRYDHDQLEWPLDAYQTVFARQPGSAEMPSAGRPFSHQLVTELVCDGVLLAPLTLHAGVSSLEADETPYPERFEVPVSTARLVNAVHARGGRVIAVGTTVARALESTVSRDGRVKAAAGWTDLVISPERPLLAIDGLISGWHEPESSHLLLLEATAGRELLERSYEAAAAVGFTGHQFGDSHLILR